MSNILIVPNSGSIYFSTGLVGSSTIPNLSSGVAFQFDNSAGVNITSYATGVSANDRFSVDGYNGRLFNVSDNLTGVIFSVNDAAGLPIIEVDSSTVDKITMGTYASNTFVINDNKVGIGTGVPAAKLDIFDNVLAGSAGLSGSILNLNQTWNTSGTPSAIKLNVTDTTSNANSLLMDLEVSGLNRFSVQKNSFTTIGASDAAVSAYMLKLVNQYGNVGFQVGGGGRLDILNNGSAVASFFSNPGGITIAGDTLRIGTNLLLNRDADNIFAQRNATNPQSFRLYNTYTDATTFERLNIKWDTNVLKIGTEKGSAGGVARAMEFQTDGTTRISVTSVGNVGIGTTTPTNLLHLYSEAQTGAAQLLVQNDTDTANPVFQLLRRRASGAAVLNRDSLGRITAAGSKSSTVNLGAGFIEFQANASPEGYSNVLPSKINFVTFVNDTYATYTNSLVNGAFVSGGTTGQFIFNKNDNIYGDYGPDTGLSRLGIGIIGIGNATAGSSGGTLIAGSVGIGTTTPASKLTVTGGDIEITDVTGGVIFKTPDGTKRYRMTIDNAGAPVFTLLA